MAKLEVLAVVRPAAMRLATLAEAKKVLNLLEVRRELVARALTVQPERHYWEVRAVVQAVLAAAAAGMAVEVETPTARPILVVAVRDLSLLHFPILALRLAFGLPMDR